VVVEPQGVESEVLDGASAPEDVVVGEGELRDVDAEIDGELVGGRHGRPTLAVQRALLPFSGGGIRWDVGGADGMLTKCGRGL
jgi:hypothetical protein